MKAIAAELLKQLRLRRRSLKNFYNRCPFKGDDLIIRQRRDKVRRIRLWDIIEHLGNYGYTCGR
jgi:hypothetical protein